MNRIDIQNSSYADCPIRMILSRISDKWSILTLFTLTQAPVMRFNELQKTIPDISQKMLTVTLRTLEEDGLVKRKIYAQVPPKVEYSLTKCPVISVINTIAVKGVRITATKKADIEISIT